ncbi:MAG: 2-hydroxyacyl-CoA dehydratase, partial [Clostridia bacterium]|nr:2-hydroxyacyl-CoA dehydratase [Clostridia bacterium]
MKDLKHLIFFENLLEDCNNELIQKAQVEGKKCIGNMCYQTPEVLMELDGVFSARLRAPRT